jgi:hypothetical protein
LIKATVCGVFLPLPISLYLWQNAVIGDCNVKLTSGFSGWLIF